MAFIAVPEVVPVKDLQVKIEAPVFDELTCYAEFCKCSKALAVQEILRKVFKMDRAFQAYLHPEQQAAVPASKQKKPKTPQAIDGAGKVA